MIKELKNLKKKQAINTFKNKYKNPAPKEQNTNRHICNLKVLLCFSQSKRKNNKIKFQRKGKQKKNSVEIKRKEKHCKEKFRKQKEKFVKTLKKKLNEEKSKRKQKLKKTV